MGLEQGSDWILLSAPWRRYGGTENSRLGEYIRGYFILGKR